MIYYKYLRMPKEDIKTTISLDGGVEIDECNLEILELEHTHFDPFLRLLRSFQRSGLNKIFI